MTATIRITEAEEHSTLEEYRTESRNAHARSYEEYIMHGHSWCWCLAGNIVSEHIYGEEHQIKYGTKQFSVGAKVFLAPMNWGDGYEKVIVIGLPRYGKKYIEVVTHFEYIENLRIKQVYSPAILKRMCSSPYCWWGDSEDDRNRIIDLMHWISVHKE